MKRLLLLTTSLLALGCGGRTSLVVQLEPNDSCASFTETIYCVGHIRLVVRGESDEVLDEQCVPFEADTLSMANLGAFLMGKDVSLDFSSGDFISLELAVFGGEVCPAADGPEPPGIPIAAGWAQVIEGEPIFLSISCESDSCVGQELLVSVQIRALNSLDDPLGEFEVGEVAVAQLSGGGLSSGRQLEYSSGLWMGSAELPGPDSCLATIVTPSDDDILSLPVVSCDPGVGDTDSQSDRGNLTGYVLDLLTASNLQNALGLQDLENTIVGRVVDENLQPVAGASVQAQSAARYPSAEYSGSQPETSTNGYFVIPGGMPCCEPLDATVQDLFGFGNPTGTAPGMTTVTVIVVPGN